MADLFLDSFYTFKAVPWPTLVRGRREVSPPETSLEKQIHGHIIEGHAYFFKGQYQNALHAYLTAWALLPCVVEPAFPVDYVRVRPEAIFELDFGESLLEAAVSLIRVRGSGVVDPVPDLEIAKVPSRLRALVDKLGHLGVVRFPQKGERLYSRALEQMRTGEFKKARALLARAAASTEDRRLKGAIEAATGVLLVQTGDFDGALRFMKRNLRSSQKIRDPETMGLAHNNLAILYQQQGKIKEANEHLRYAAEMVPLALDRSVVQRLNPGTVSEIIRPMGKTGLNFILPGTGEGAEWTVLSTTAPSALRLEKIGILRDSEVMSIPLNAEGVQSLRQSIYEARIRATTLRELRTFEEVSIVQFVTYLTHVWGFVLPVALGDTYHELGEYGKAVTYFTMARNYKYLNLAIEMPSIWRRMAQSYLDHGQLLYKEQDMAGARLQLEHIVKISGNTYVLSGPLYSGAFASMKQKVLNLLNAADWVGFGGLSYSIRSIVLEALIDLRRILANINWLGFPDDIIPIYSFDYLQNVARYMADHAIQAERTFLSFKSRQEQETYTRRLLEDAVKAEEAALAVEEKRVEAAEAQRDAAKANADLAQVRVDNANATLTDYANVSWQLQELDASIALANAAANDTDVEVTPGRAAQLGIEPGTYEARYYVKLLTRRRHQVNRAFEERNMRRRRDELVAAKAVADAQVTVADEMVEVGKAQKNLAEVRLENARARLEHFNEEMLTPELWDNLSREIRHIARQYLRWAIGAAFLMERAFEFENDREVNRIRFDYDRSELQGLLAADFLKQDIESFTYARVLETEKKIPMKEVISLSERYPFQFYRQFQKTGRIDFETHLEDFDRRYPGAYLRKIRSVEVVIEGLVPPEGLHGTLTNSGTSFYRDRQGNRKTRFQKPETLLLSRYVKRRDRMVMMPDEKMLELFEHTGVATGWILDLPPQQNNVDYRTLVDIKMVIHYEAFHSEAVTRVVKAELATEPDTYSLGFGLAYEFPEAFFELQDTGEVTFTLAEEDLPYFQTNPHLTDMTIILQTRDAGGVTGIELEVTATGAGITAGDTTDANGQIAAAPGGTAPLNQFLARSLADTWRIRIDKGANAAAFGAGFSWEDVSNIFFWAEYDFTPRTL